MQTHKKLTTPWKGFVEHLLKKDPLERLGNKGFEDFENHLVFKGIDWDKLEKKELPSPLQKLVAQHSQKTGGVGANKSSKPAADVEESETEEYEDIYDIELNKQQ